MAIAMATGRQLMQGIHPTGMVPHLTYMPPNADWKLPVWQYSAKRGLEASGVAVFRQMRIGSFRCGGVPPNGD